MGNRRNDVGEERVIAHLGTSKNDLARHKDQKHDLGLDHTVDETREQLRKDEKSSNEEKKV
jgi:hypothetical protein